MKNFLRFSFILTVVAFVAVSCSKSEQYDRPNDPWVFRSVLDSIPRVVTFALDKDMWVAYSTQNASMYKAWKGRVDFDGAVYTTQHGPQPTTVGDAWFENVHQEPWRIKKDGKEVKPKAIHYKGHRYQKGHAHLKYELELNDGAVINITEQPEVVKDGSGIKLERTFNTSDVPKGVEVGLYMNVSSVAFAESVSVEGGTFEIGQTEKREKNGLLSMDVDGYLTLKANDKTTVTTQFVNQPMIDHPKKKYMKEEAKIEEHPGYTLIAQNDCKTCHNPYRQTIGPAYIAVARRYKNNEDNLKTLVKKVKAGGAGNWGEAAMNAHPNLEDDDISTMVSYILEMDAEEEAEAEVEEVEIISFAPADVKAEDLNNGVLTKFFYANNPQNLASINFNGTPAYESIATNISLKPAVVKWAEDNFAFSYDGYLEIKDAGNHTFRLMSDDGSKLWVNDQLVADNDGLHGMGGPEVILDLKQGFYKFKVQFFENGGGFGLALDVKVPGNAEWTSVPYSMLKYHKTEQAKNPNVKPMPWAVKEIPGDAFPLTEVHPSYDLSQARPDIFTPKVGGMDFLSDGRMVICTWDPAGSVYILDNVDSGDPSKIKTKLIGSGLAEPLGLKVVNDEIYIMQKQELTKLIDHDGDDVIDEYQTLCDDWRVSANFHEFGFGLAHRVENGKGYFYAALATGIEAGGASSSPQIPDRGKAIKIAEDGSGMEFVAHGLRTPNGVGIGVDGEVFISDNQGDWLPSSKVVHVKKGAWYGSRSVDPEGTKDLVETQPVVWLPQDEIGNSPGQIVPIEDGPYQGQMLHSEVTHGGLKRVFVEKVNGEYQGALFRFTQGLEAGINRLCWGPDGALYVGGIGSTGNWGHDGKLYYGLQRLKYNEKSTFEMLAVRAKSNGLEIEFTEPLKEGDGWNPADFELKRWWYKPTVNYGGPKMDETELPVKSATVSKDRKKVFLEFDGMKEQHVYYVRLKNHYISSKEHQLWTSEVWYNMNNIPTEAGTVTAAPTFAPNTLTASQKKDGWKLLFNGQDLKGWHIFDRKTDESAWSVENGTLTFTPTSGKWGDIVTDKAYQNYILELEWKISDCGNSGIFLNVSEDKQFDATWKTGIEMQVLDNTCHPDAQIFMHRAGDLYDLVPCKYETVNTAMEWNRVRIKIQDGKSEFWLNGHKIVDFEMWTDEWDTMVAASKFNPKNEGMENAKFGQYHKGKIALQDHGDKVWYRNIKIKELPKTEI